MKENVLKKQGSTSVNLTDGDISINVGNVSMPGMMANDEDSSFSELKTPTGQNSNQYITPTQNLGLAQSKKLVNNAPQSVHHQSRLGNVGLQN
jgi:hypothetical protein